MCILNFQRRGIWQAEKPKEKNAPQFALWAVKYNGKNPAPTQSKMCFWWVGAILFGNKFPRHSALKKNKIKKRITFAFNLILHVGDHGPTTACFFWHYSLTEHEVQTEPSIFIFFLKNFANHCQTNNTLRITTTILWKICRQLWKISMLNGFF